MSFAYTNNGLSFRTVSSPGELVAGEIFFDHVPSPTELQGAFPGYVAGVVAGLLVDKLAAGCKIISTGTPAVSATYGIDPETQKNIIAVGLYIVVNSRFPAGQTTWPGP